MYRYYSHPKLTVPKACIREYKLYLHVRFLLFVLNKSFSYSEFTSHIFILFSHLLLIAIFFFSTVYNLKFKTRLGLHIHIFIYLFLHLSYRQTENVNVLMAQLHSHSLLSLFLEKLHLYNVYCI